MLVYDFKKINVQSNTRSRAVLTMFFPMTLNIMIHTQKP